MNNLQWIDCFLKDVLQPNCSKYIIDEFIKIKTLVLKARKKDKNLFFLGNGASNTIATHTSLDFSNNIGIKCFSFNDSSMITAYSNDFGYNKSFNRFIKIFARKNDIVFLISSSGESKNVIMAAKSAKEKKCKVVTFTGFKKNNSLSKLGDMNFWVESTIYNVVESVHFLWLAMLCDFIVKDEQKNIGKHGMIL